MSLIKPCPFCGSEAEPVRYDGEKKIMCTNDKCLCSRLNWFVDVREAIKDWNERDTVDGQEVVPMTKPDFGRTYDYIYDVAAKHSVPDCAAIMDAAVRIYLDEKDRYLNAKLKAKEEEDGSH